MTQFLGMIYLKFLIGIITIKHFFQYTIRGKKTPFEELREQDPYIYEEDE